MIYLGTSGYSYADWVGPYYPPGTPKGDFLSYYARDFNCCEINYTYYRLPAARTLAAMAAKTPPEFRFTVKATGELTHERRSEPALFQQFREALAPLCERGQLGAVLVQFPSSFRPGTVAQAYLRFVRDQWPELPLVVEFRHAAWAAEATFELLQTLNMGFCCVDEPRLSSLMPPVTAVTAAVGYLRLHGRNAARWFDHAEAWERYDYRYDAEELQQCVERVQTLSRQAGETYVMFNNHYQAQAIRNAQELGRLLGELE